MANPPVTDRRLRLALVGIGRIANSHIEALRLHAGRAKWVAVCDNQPERVASGAQRTGALAFHTLDALLTSAEVQPDLVVLATPSGLHPGQAILCAQAGVHVLTEKPMATKWDEGMAMVRACRDAGVKLFVVKQNRLNPTIQCLKSAIHQGRFGRIVMVNVNVFWTRPQSYYDEAVHAYTATLARDIEAEDTGVMSLRLISGGLASINVTMLTHDKNFEGSITVLGEKGTVRIGGVAVNQIQHWQFDEARPEDEQIQSANYETSSVYGYGHSLVYANVLDTLQGMAHAEVDGYQGLRSLEVIIAAYRSARDGVRVGLPLVF